MTKLCWPAETILRWRVTAALRGSNVVKSTADVVKFSNGDSRMVGRTEAAEAGKQDPFRQKQLPSKLFFRACPAIRKPSFPHNGSRLSQAFWTLM